MLAVTNGIARNQYLQFCMRFCIQSNTRIQKYSSNKSHKQEKVNEKKNWWENLFSNAFGKYLLLTNTVSCGLMMAIGDLIQQEIEYRTEGKHEDSFDWHRNSEPLSFLENMATVGSLQGPFTHFFYQKLDKYFPGTNMSSIAQKIILDQSLASPFCIFLFFLGMNYLNNEKLETSTAELRKKFWIVYVADCFVWIPAQFFNFYVLSSKYRVIYINILTMCYNIFLSYIKHSHNST